MTLRHPILLLAAVLMLGLSANNNRPYNFNQNLDWKERQWVDSVFAQMNEAERIGQLFMIRAHSDKDAAYEQDVETLIRQYKVGGLCFFQGTPEKQAALTNRYQAAAGKLPLLIAMDAEWGLGMRLKESTPSFPHQLTLGALKDNRLVYEMGAEIARQCRRIGVQLNFAPVADVNNNAANPVINDRSFGEDRYNVAAKCFQYMMGLQDGGVMACAKHFPGHGDTNMDSHLDLPLIGQTPERLDSLELFPFRVLSQYGIGSMMVAHLSVPALDTRPNRPTTLSRSAVHDLLRSKIGFNGIIFTDAMEMKGVAKYFGPGEADVEALRAGNDMVLLPANLGASIEAIYKALDDGLLDRDELYSSVRRILRAKYRLGLTAPAVIDTMNIRRDLNTPESEMLRRRLVASALTLVRDKNKLAGFPEIEKYNFASLAIGDTLRTPFQTTCGYYAPITHHNIPYGLSDSTRALLLDSLRQFDVVLVSLHHMSSKAALNYGLDSGSIEFIRQLERRTKVVLTVFGNPYALRYFDNAGTILEAYQSDPATQELSAQALFGAIDIGGSLPVTASMDAHYGQGISMQPGTYRLGYDIPEAVGMSSDTLRQIDALVAQLIAEGAAPGCQVLLVKDNKVVWNKAYGQYMYDSSEQVSPETIYDLASVTKVAASTLAVMMAYDAGRFDISRPMSSYLPELANTNKSTLTTEEIMAHQAGLTAWIPFYQATMTTDGRPSPEWYHSQPEKGYNIPVAAHLYMADRYVDTIWSNIFKSELHNRGQYKYSDLGLYLTARTLERINGKPLDAVCASYYYKPMGLATTTFNPWRYGLAARCAPTEDDTYFRLERMQGYVHDMGAAMLGGVSGHAGLFSDANDLAKIFQMLLNGGEYGGRRYLRTSTVEYFTTRYKDSTRRGIGFDMKELDPHASMNMSTLASEQTFGHLGFTGNAVWADPDKQLIFVFLSNRTFPTMKNNKLINGDYRPRIQQIAYKAILP